jgi:hypothetical protein
MCLELNEALDEIDLAFEQFMVRYNSVTDGPEIRKEYNMFMGERMRISGILFKARENAKIDTARNCLKMGLSVEEVTELSGLPLDTIQEIQLNP